MSPEPRSILARLGVRSPHPRPQSALVEGYGLRIEDDTASVNSALPAYSPRIKDRLTRAASPSPTYRTVDESEPSPSSATVTQPDIGSQSAQINARAAVDGLVTRLNDTLNNPKSWRLLNSGEKSFFWALRCPPGAADIFNDNIREIQDRVFGGHDWRVEKFCFILKGQQLKDLWCRPIQSQVCLLHFLNSHEEIWHTPRPVEGGLYCRSCIQGQLKNSHSNFCTGA
jgi:hypothetical protein